jgi:hypothetical protein
MRQSLRTPQRERGSVYVLALLVLLILTIVGLALSLVTQTELQIGANERMTQQAFYATNSGIDMATAKALVLPDHRSFQIDIAEPDSRAGVHLGHRLEVSPFLPILDAPCNLCQINEDVPFFKINHAVASTATRIAWMGPAGTPPPANPTPLAQKRLSVLVSFQPWTSSITAKVEALTDTNRGGLDFAF